MGDFSAMANGQIKVAGTTDNGTRIGCVKKFWQEIYVGFLFGGFFGAVVGGFLEWFNSNKRIEEDNEEV